MPYAVRKSGDKHKVVNKKTGRVYGTHDSKEKANRQLAALHINTGESKIILKQDVILESNGVITVIPQDTEIEFTDRYEALGIKKPDPEKMCKGHCEGTGYYPAFNPEFKFPEDDRTHCYPTDKTPLEPVILALWQAAEAENPTDDGWHFIECPDCNGRGEIEISQLTESKVISETIMDRAFDNFNNRFPPIVKDGYYEINSPMDDFVCYLVENHGWYINRHRKVDSDLPSSGYTWLVHRSYPHSKIVVSCIGNNKIKVEEKALN